MNEYKLTAPLQADDIAKLRAGDKVLLSGTIYTARDAAHKRFFEALSSGEPLPVDLCNQTVFYAGPCPTPPGKASGSIGPTTSFRMDAYTPALLSTGMNAIIGKGDRSAETRRAIADAGAVYMTAIGGCAAYMAKCVESVEVAAYDDLGTESVKRLCISDMPLTVAIDSLGADIYEDAAERYFISLQKN